MQLEFDKGWTTNFQWYTHLQQLTRLILIRQLFIHGNLVQCYFEKRNFYPIVHLPEAINSQRHFFYELTPFLFENSWNVYEQSIPCSQFLAVEQINKFMNHLWFYESPLNSFNPDPNNLQAQDKIGLGDTGSKNKRWFFFHCLYNPVCKCCSENLTGWSVWRRWRRFQDGRWRLPRHVCVLPGGVEASRVGRQVMKTIQGLHSFSLQLAQLILQVFQSRHDRYRKEYNEYMML